jgi:hypothetical protein
MEIKIDKIIEALKFLRADNKKEFENIIHSLNKGDKKELLDALDKQELKARNINLGDYR